METMTMISIPCPLDLAFPDNDSQVFNAADLRRFCGYTSVHEHDWAVTVATTVLTIERAHNHPEIDLWDVIFAGDNKLFTRDFALMLIMNCRNGHANVFKVQNYISIMTRLEECKHLPDDQQTTAIERLLMIPIDQVIALMQPVDTSDPDIPF